ncbi:hypothetical protein SAMN05421504_102994 [Amycolatopsis xylanica]|uniref:Uncharacterized protein n=1 Tax=Amycolatopsis xylanica TaxID=589385 RepID=A0A1H3AN74_9PSEU|nr:hypothetical protein SAMN05421504_102994 [Amycolatopsis xylanica]
MAHGSATEGRGAVRSSRWVSRALFVLGGAAAAWMISDASASAAEEPAAPSGASAGLTPLTDATVTGLNDATRGVSGFAGDAAGAATTGYRDAVCHQDATAWTLPGESAKQSPAWCTDAERNHKGRVEHEVSSRVSDAVTDLASDAVVHPVSRTLGAFEHIVRKPEDAQQVLGETLQPADGGELGQRVWDLLNHNDATDVVLPSITSLLPERDDLPTAAAPATTEAPALQLVTVVIPDSAKSAFSAAFGATSEESTDVQSDSRDDQSGSKLPFPLDRLPIAPSAPTAPGGGTAPGGHCDGPAFGFIPGASAALINASVSNALTGVRYMPLTPGSQPGVTPD